MGGGTALSNEVKILVKRCKVISNNGKISIVQFDDVKVQIPNCNDDVAYIKFENGKYYVSSKEDFEKLNTDKKKKQNKKETVETEEKIEEQNNCDR